MTIEFTYGDENEVHGSTDMISMLPSITFSADDNQSIPIVVEIIALEVGHLVIGAKSKNIAM